jgi:ubiquinone/menaquinone biosynthesis C-methylase UbiE
MTQIDTLCRAYQSMFRSNYAEQAQLVELHSAGRMDEFHAKYFEHEYRKGERSIRRFAELATGWQGGRSLDFGCGGGGLTYRLAEVSREAVGIDLDDAKLEFARRQADRLGATNADFVCYDGKALPFADESFDSILCVDVIEHLPNPERFVTEFVRVLKPGGKLLLSFGPPWLHAHGKHMWGKLPGWWTHLLFPRPTVMRVSGFPAQTTWEEIGLHRLSVGTFRRIMKQSGLTFEHHDEKINRVLTPFKYVPLLRELFIGEVVGVYRKG